MALIVNNSSCWLASYNENKQIVTQIVSQVTPHKNWNRKQAHPEGLWDIEAW